MPSANDSFAHILQKAINTSAATSNLSRNLELNSGLEPAWMSQLMAKITPCQSPTTDSVKSTLTARYQRFSLSPYTAPTPIRPPSHTLNAEQTLALEHLNSILRTQHSAALEDNFTLPELKSAYRKALLKSHPDHGGSFEKFQIVRKSYEILSVLVTK